MHKTVSDRKRAKVAADATSGGGPAADDVERKRKALRAVTQELHGLFRLVPGAATMYVANVVSLLRYLYDKDMKLRARVACWGTQAGACVDYIFAVDEATGGNVLQTQQSKKMTFLYMVVLDGHQSCEAAWWTLAAVPRKEKSKCGWSACLAQLLEALQKQNYESGLFLGGKFVRLRLRGLLSDYEGLAESYSARGAAGLKPCLRCSNCLSSENASAKASDRFITIEDTLEKAEAVDDEQLFQVYDKYIDAPEASKAKTEERDRCLGFTVSASSLLGQRQVRGWIPPSRALYDTTHNYFANGVVGSELLLFRKALESKNLWSLERLREQVKLQGWQRPFSARQHGQTDYWRNKLFWECMWKGDNYKESATACLLVFPLFHHLVEEHLRGGAADMILELQSLRALSECTRAIYLLRRAKGPSAWDDALRALELAQGKHHKAFSEAYAGDWASGIWLLLCRCIYVHGLICDIYIYIYNFCACPCRMLQTETSFSASPPTPTPCARPLRGHLPGGIAAPSLQVGRLRPLRTQDQ